MHDVLSSFGEDDYVLFDCPGQARSRAACLSLCSPSTLPQIELYSHVTVFNTFSEALKQQGWRCAPGLKVTFRRPPELALLTRGSPSMCVVYLLDSQFIIDAPKYISGCLVRSSAALASPLSLGRLQAALSSMLQLELPHVNVLSKVDLLREKKATLEE